MSDGNAGSLGDAGYWPTNRVGQIVHAAVRAVVGFLIACHGAQAFFGEDPAEFGDWPSWYAGILELGGGLLVIVGLFTRASAFVLSGVMAFAYFTVHQSRGALPISNDGEQAASYSWIFLLFVVIGAGKYSLDHVIASRRGARQPQAAGV
ncbi:MAG TPA: DoxX family protein [Pseudonocardia sp.]|nr:DoxX family protein [Pseudonocardia sp.]